jgi:large subunit ribosomal protein L21
MSLLVQYHNLYPSRLISLRVLNYLYWSAVCGPEEEYMFAVVTISGKQYKVKVGDVIVVDKIEGKTGDSVTFDHVLLTNDKGKTVVGMPTVVGSKVKGKIIAQEQGEKVEVRRYKQKVRYRRQNGYRADLTRIEIVTVL